MSRNLEPLMTVEEVAEYFSKTPQSIRKWVNDGELKYSKKIPKGTFRFDPDYIRSIGKVDFEIEGCSPEVYRLRKNYEKDIKRKDEEIARLKSRLLELHTKSTQAMNEILNIEMNA
ncbi:helix-turn-helix domain-containing protein [Clostridium baratii]